MQLKRRLTKRKTRLTLLILKPRPRRRLLRNLSQSRNLRKIRLKKRKKRRRRKPLPRRNRRKKRQKKKLRRKKKRKLA